MEHRYTFRPIGILQGYHLVWQDDITYHLEGEPIGLQVAEMSVVFAVRRLYVAATMIMMMIMIIIIYRHAGNSFRSE
jgi:hypothetical protein